MDTLLMFSPVGFQPGEYGPVNENAILIQPIFNDILYEQKYYFALTPYMGAVFQVDDNQ